MSVTYHKKFKVEVKDRFLPLIAIREEETTSNALWECEIEAIQRVAEETVSRKKKMKKPWISEHAAKLAEEIRGANSKGNGKNWKMLDKEVTKRARNDENRYLQQNCVEMEKEGDKSSKQVFQILREMTGKWVPRTYAIKDKTGRALTESNDIKRT